MAQDGLTGYTFDGGAVQSSKDAAFYNWLSNREGVVNGYNSEVSVNTNGMTLEINTGMVVIQGRLVEITKPIIIKLDTNYSGFLVLRVDLTKVNDYSGDPRTSDYRFTLNQAEFMLVDELVKSTVIYDLLFAEVSTNDSEITTFKLNNSLYTNFSQNKIETINNAFYGGLSDVSGIRAQFISEIKPFRNAVMQQVWLDPYRAEWYITQSDSQTTEGFVISRLHASGKLISSVWLPSSGHGTQVIFKHDANNDVSFFVRYFDGTSNLYHGVYKDNTTFNKSDLTLVGSLASSATGQFMHYGNAFAQLADDGNLYIWQTEYNVNTSTFTQHADSMIVHKYADDIPSTTVGQGMTLIKKSAITGDNSGSETNKYIVIRLAGETNNRATLYSWEIDIKTKRVVFIGEVNGLQNGPHGQFDPNTGNISGDFEPEGVSAVEYGLDNLGSGGIIWGLSTGAGGYRKSYLYGFLSETLSSLVNAMSLTKNEINAFYPESLGSSYSYMYQLRGNDVYRGQSTDYKRYKDFPFPYRGSNATNIEWVLENIGNDMRNEWMQRLTILNYGFNVYTRKVSIDNLSYGKSPVYTYDKWSVNIDNAYVDETFKNTSSMASNSAIGMRYYFSSSEISGMADSGLKSIIGERGSMLENRLLTNNSMIQTVTANSSAGRYVAYRKVSLNVDEFGTGGVISSPSNWFAG